MRAARRRGAKASRLQQAVGSNDDNEAAAGGAAAAEPQAHAPSTDHHLFGPLDEALPLQLVRPLLDEATLAALRQVSRAVCAALDSVTPRVRLHLGMMQQALALELFRRSAVEDEAAAPRSSATVADLAQRPYYRVMASVGRWPAAERFEAVGGDLPAGLVPQLVQCECCEAGQLPAVQLMVSRLPGKGNGEAEQQQQVAAVARLQFACGAALHGAISPAEAAQQLRTLEPMHLTWPARYALQGLGTYAAFRPAFAGVLQEVVRLLRVPPTQQWVVGGAGSADGGGPASCLAVHHGAA